MEVRGRNGSSFAAHVHYACRDSLVGDTTGNMEKLKCPERKHLIEGKVSHPFSRQPKVALGLIKILPSLKTEGGGWVCDLTSSPPPHAPPCLGAEQRQCVI